MTKWRLIIDEPPWVRLFGEDDRVVATCLPGEPVSALIDHLSPGDRIDVCVDAPSVDAGAANAAAHRCEGPELWTSRMQLALLSNDLPAYDVVVNQVGSCSRCWAAIAHWTLSLVAGDRAARAGGNDAAAGYVLKEIARLTTNG
jgi:hypothetical protein